MRTRQFSSSLSVALPQDRFELIKEIADEGQISIAEWVSDAVAIALNSITREEDL